MFRTTEETARMWENAGCKEIADAFYAQDELEGLGSIQEILDAEGLSDLDSLADVFANVREENEQLREALQTIAAIRSDLKAPIEAFLLAPEQCNFDKLLDENKVLHY